MRALLNDEREAVTRAEAADVGETLLGDDDVEVMLSVVNVRGHRDDARDSGRIRLGRPRRGRVHDRDGCVAEEVAGAAEAVKHLGAERVGAVGMGVAVNLDWGVHRNDAEPADDLGRVGNLLRAQQQPVLVVCPVPVELLKALGREADRCRRGKGELIRVKEVKEGVLENLGPNVDLVERTLGEAA